VGVRVVSLLPSATEIVYALGMDEHLVGVTFECDEPAAARTKKAVVVGGRDTRGMTPREIDRYVREQLAAGGDLYTLHADALRDLRPDVVLTQDLCRVCALPTAHVGQALDYLGCDADVVSLDPASLQQVLDTIMHVGDRLGVPVRAQRLVFSLRRRLADIAARVGGRPRPRMAVVEWVDPPFTGGHWVPDLVTAAGGTPVAAHPGGRSRQTTWDDVRTARPDVVVVAPCGFHLDAAVDQAKQVLPHLPGPAVWAIDADGLVVRPGPRLIDGVEALAAILHPDLAGPPHPAAARIVRRPEPPQLPEVGSRASTTGRVRP
jgi:iron complex transport system substrate-binding protein